MLRPEASHDVGRVATLLLIADSEPRHIRLACGIPKGDTIHLLVHVGEVVSGIHYKLPLVASAVRYRNGIPMVVLVRIIARSQASNLGVLRLHEPQHVIKRTVFHHQDNDVLNSAVRRH